MGVSTWPGRGRLIVGAPILRVHLHVSWAPRNRSRKRGHAQLWSPINSHKFGPPHARYIACPRPSTKCVQLHTQTGHPDVPTLCPHLSTYAHNLTHDMGTQTTAGLTRFRQLWATTNFVGGQALFWASTKLGANAHSWTSKADNHWASTRNRGSPRVIVGSHAILWATTRFPERPRNCVSRPREVMDAHT